ncbi:MAG: LIM domain-containing protein [Cloacibacillus sp.]
MEENTKLTCSRCGVGLEPRCAYFSYLEHSFHTEVMRCPQCGQVFIPESLAKGKMAQVEISIEDK